MKKVLLIAGGGTLGQYTSEELLNNGCKVDVICLEDYVSDNPCLCYYKANATYEYLIEFLKEKYYDGIVNFIHYTDVESYKKVHVLLCSKTDQLVFLSSYRVYADLQHPITETAPRLIDVVKDKTFLETEDYAVPKSRCEAYIRENQSYANWTIVRPVISFSNRRYDIMLPQSAESLKKHISEKTPIILPKTVKNLTAGVDWAKNSGKLIASLLFKKEAMGEAFTVSTAQNLTWGEVAELYTKLCGVSFEWVEMQEYMEMSNQTELPWILQYDRMYNREINNSKILKVTGLKNSDFYSIEEGIREELKKENIVVFK